MTDTNDTAPESNTTGPESADAPLHRRGMLEMYVDDYLFPVYAMHPGTGRLGVSNTSVVTGVRRWDMSLPAR